MIRIEATGIENSLGINDSPDQQLLQPSVHQCSAGYDLPTTGMSGISVVLDIVLDCILLDVPEVVDGVAANSVRVHDAFEIRDTFRQAVQLPNRDVPARRVVGHR